MNLKIYQIDLDRDSGNVCFLNYEGLSKIKDSNAVDSSIYNEVFSGEVECENLNEIYLKFNIDTPDDYKGRSLSVSDVIEIKAPSEENKFYFCDSIGFKEIDFDVSQTQKLPDNSKITVLLLKPGEVAKEVKIDNTLEAHQKIVGGYIEVCMPFEDNAAIICSEEGKIENLPYCRAIYASDGRIDDVIAGNFFIASTDCYTGEFKSLSPELMKKYKKLFKFPEKYMTINDEFVAVPYKPKDKDKER